MAHQDSNARGRALAPILTLELFEPEPAVVQIFGKVYELRPMELFSAAQLRRLNNAWGPAADILSRLDESDEITDGEERVLDYGYEQVIRAAIPDLPSEDLHRLTPTQKQQLVGAFFEETGRRASQPKVAEAAPRRTGERSSRSSNATTERGTRRRG